MLTCFRHIWD